MVASWSSRTTTSSANGETFRGISFGRDASGRWEEDGTKTLVEFGASSLWFSSVFSTSGAWTGASCSPPSIVFSSSGDEAPRVVEPSPHTADETAEAIEHVVVPSRPPASSSPSATGEVDRSSFCAIDALMEAEEVVRIACGCDDSSSSTTRSGAAFRFSVSSSGVVATVVSDEEDGRARE